MMDLRHGDGSKFTGRADLILTNPYAAIPLHLHNRPMILSLFEGKGSRQSLAEGWIGGRRITRLSAWGAGGNNTVYVAALPAREIDLTDLVEDPFEPGRGWFPLDLPARLLDLYSDFWKPGDVVLDPFMGRGTVGRACLDRELSFVGIDIAHERVRLAREYLGAVTP